MKQRIAYCFAVLFLLISMQFAAAEGQHIEVALEPCLDYDSVDSFFHAGLVIVEKDDQYGLIDSKGEEIVAPQYDSISYNRGFFRVSREGKYGLLDGEGEEIIPVEYQNVLVYTYGLCAVQKEDKWGYLDEKASVAVPLDYDDANLFERDRALVVKADKYGYLGSDGKVAIPLQFDKAGSFSSELALVEKDGQRLFIDDKGAVQITIGDENVKPNPFFYDGIPFSLTTGGGGVMSREGETILEAVYGLVGSFKNYLVTSYQDKYGVFDFREGEAELLIPFTYDDIRGPYYRDESQSDAPVFAAKSDGKWGLIDAANEYILKPQYDELNANGQNGMGFRGLKEDRVDLISMDGDIISELDYDLSSDMLEYISFEFAEGYARVRKEGKFGFIDAEGELAVEAIYEEAGLFSDGYAAVKLGDQWGILQIRTGEDEEAAPPAQMVKKPEPQAQLIVLTIGSKTVLVDGQAAPAMRAVPAIKENRTVVPLDYLVTELLQGSVQYDEDGSLTLVLDKGQIACALGQTKASYQGDEYDLDVAPFEQDGVLFVPVKLLQPVMKDIVWDAANLQVSLSY